MRRGAAYLVVGAWNTLFGYGLFALLHWRFGDSLHYLVILTVATAASVLNAFFGYRRFVFRVEGPILPDLARFSLVYLAAFAVNAALLPVLVEVAGLSVLLAQALVVAGTVLASFFAHRHISFRRPDHDGATAVTSSGSEAAAG